MGGHRGRWQSAGTGNLGRCPSGLAPLASFLPRRAAPPAPHRHPPELMGTSSVACASLSCSSLLSPADCTGSGGQAGGRALSFGLHGINPTLSTRAPQ